MWQYCEKNKDFTTKKVSLSSLSTTDDDYSSIHPDGSLFLYQGQVLDSSIEHCSEIQKSIASAEFECPLDPHVSQIQSK